jgi:hypothetical protein
VTQLQLRLNLITEMAGPKRFFGVFAKLRKANLSFMCVRPPACLPARMEQLRSNRTDFHEIPYLIFLRKSVHKNMQVH